MSTSMCWELTCDGLVSLPGGVKLSHPLNTTETGDKRRAPWATRFVKDLASHIISSRLRNMEDNFDVHTS